MLSRRVIPTKLYKRITARLFIFDDGPPNDPYNLEFRGELCLFRKELVHRFHAVSVNLTIMLTMEWELVIHGERSTDRFDLPVLCAPLPDIQELLRVPKAFQSAQ